MKSISTFLKACLSLPLLVFAFFSNATSDVPLVAGQTTQYASYLEKGTLLFTENKGQVADVNGKPMPEVLFSAHHNGIRIFLTKTGIQYQFTKESDNDKVETHRFGIQLLGTRSNAIIRKEAQNELKENFYLSNCPQGITGVSTFGRVVYENVYPGIDWVIYSKGDELEYDFIVKPGADVSLIRLKVNDANKAAINASGELVMETALGIIKENAPVSFVDNKKVASRFVQYSDNSFGFSVKHPSGKTLIIDPTVQWSSYFGGSNLEVARNSATDANGNIYLSGWTNSSTGIASAGQQTVYGGGNYDAFLVKLSASGTLKWATYYGGSGTDYGYACAVNSNGNAVYLAGTCSSTTSGAISTTGSHQATNGGSNDAYLVQFDSNGVRQWGTYYGGTSSDYGYGCAVDGGENVYLTGYTGSTTGIATTGATQVTLGSVNDAFLVKFTSTGTRVWGTYYGGAAEDRAYACSAYGSKIFIAGYTGSTTGFATSGTFESIYNGGTYDMFAVQFDSTGTRDWATYYGGTGSDYGYGCAAYNGGVYLSGYTTSSTLTLASDSAYQTVTGGSYESLLARLDNTGNRIWGTFFGGTGGEYSYGCSVSPQGDVYLSGYTTSTASIANNGFQNTNGGSSDAFIAKFKSTGSLIWSSYFGSTENDTSYTCAAVNGGVYLLGHTASIANIATTGAYQTTLAGVQDAFITKVSDPIITLGNISTTVVCTGTTINIPFNAYGAYNTGNTFTAQLSDASGSFTSLVAIGTTINSNGSIATIVPVGTMLGNGYRVRVASSNPVLTSENNGTNLIVNAIPANPASIIGSNNTCPGSPEVYHILAPGNATSYTWSVPATWTGTSTTDTLQVVSGTGGGNVTVTANNSCGSSNATTLAVVISSIVAPGAIVSANDTSICAGIPVVFEAVAFNGGTAPSFQWKKNGLNVGMNSSSYTDATLNNNDSVYVIMTSTSLCVDTLDAESNKIIMQLNPLMNPTVVVTANPGTTVPTNQTITFMATITNAGDAPAYQWYVSGTAIVGAVNNTFTLTGLLEGDSVSVLVIADNVNSDYCTTTDSVLSEALVIHVTSDPPTGIKEVTALDGLNIYPNPSKGQLYLNGDFKRALSEREIKVGVLNAIGQLVQEASIKSTSPNSGGVIDLESHLANGFYFLKLQSNSGHKVLPFILNR